MVELFILGIGSPFGDDRLGWEAVQVLKQRKKFAAYSSQQLQLLGCDRPGLNLLALMQDAKTVFLIDAVKTGAKIGTLLCFRDEEIAAINSPRSTHDFGIAHAIEMGKILNLLPKKLLLYGVEVGEFEFQFATSGPIKKGIHALITQIEKDIINYLNKASYPHD